ncbi:MAG: hypothetical protein ACPG8W_01245 [Candidatus Promineifilaceae bacterium]
MHRQGSRLFIGFGCLFGSFLVVGLFVYASWTFYETVFLDGGREPTTAIEQATLLAPPTVGGEESAELDSLLTSVSAEVEETRVAETSTTPKSPTDRESAGSAIQAPISQRIAYTSNEAGNFEIFTANVDGSNKVRLTDNWFGDWRPVWSTDASSIAFHSKRDGNWEIYTMTAEGENQTNLTSNSADDSFPDWSPDNSQILFHSNRDGDYDIFIMNADGSDPINLTKTQANEYGPVWSPDGSQIAFSRQLQDGRELFIMNTDGSDERRLTNSTGANFFPMWSPDGTQLVFHSNRDSNYEIYRIDADGSNETRLTNDEKNDFFPAYSPDGEWIVYHTNTTGSEQGNRDIIMLSADLTQEQVIIGSPSQERMPTWMP